MCFLLRRVNVTNFSITLLCLITAFGIYIDKKYSVVSVTSPVTSNARPPPSSEERVPVSLPDESLSEESRNAIVYDCATWQPLPERINSVARGQAGHGHANITAESQEDKDVADISKRRSWRKLKTNKLVDNPSVDNSDLKDVKYVFAALHAIINRLKIELNKKIIKVIDLFCGDDNALKLFLDFREDVEYTGEDVCPDTGTVVSHRHINAYIDNVSFIFKNVDIVNNTLKDPYDVIVCRKLLHRLRMNDAMNILKRISKSGSRFLIATTNSDVKLNSDIVQTESQNNSKADNVISATSTTTDASKADIEASKPPEEILKMAKLMSVAQTGVKRLEDLARSVDAKAEAQIAHMDDEIMMLAMQVRKLDRAIEIAVMGAVKSGSDVKTAKAETDTANINVKAEDMKACSANVKVNKDVRNDKAVNKADTGSRKASEISKLDGKIKTADKEATATPETKNTKEIKDVPATDKVNKGVGNDEGVVQKADADMGMNGTEADLAIVKADVNVKKTNEGMKTFDDAWTCDVDSALIAMVAREGHAVLSTPVKVAPEDFTVKERNDICKYWTEKLDLNKEKYRCLRRDVAYFGSM